MATDSSFRAALLVIFGPVLLLALFAAPWLTLAMPWDPDETRYLEVPREMASSGDWLLPRLNGVIYLEKPPLYYWVLAALFRALGPSPILARLVSLGSAAGIVVLTARLGATLSGSRLGKRAGVVLATSPLFLVLSTIVTIDMFFALWVTAAIAALVLGFQASNAGQRRGAKVSLLAYVFLGLAVLTKGPVGIVVPGLVWLFGRPKGAKLFPPRFLLGTAIFLAVSAPWFVAVSFRVPGFLEFFFLRGNVSRFFGDDAEQISLHSEPYWFYIPILLGGGFPWSLLLPAPARTLWSEIASDSPRRLAWAWLVPGFLFFTISAGKLPTYIVPLLPGFALLGASRWEDVEADRPACRFWALGAFAVTAVAAVGAVGAVVWLTFFPSGLELPDDLDRRLAFTVTAGMAVLALTGFICLTRRRTSRGFGSLIAMMAVAYAGGAFLKLPFDRERSLEPVAKELARVRKPGDVVVGINRYLPLLSFALEEPIYIVGKRGELTYGSETLGERPDLFVDFERLRAWIDGPERVFVAVHFTRRERTEAALGRPLELLARRGGFLLLSDQALPWGLRP